MVVVKEQIFEWEPHIREDAQERILERSCAFIDVIQEKQKIKKSFLKKITSTIKAKESLAYAIIVNLLILISSIIVIVLFIKIKGLLANPILILGVLIITLLFTLYEVLKLAERQTNCKNSR
ncbi:MAG: hypothetical protein ACFFBZ_07110 [Promethearchaeota archaeon]